MEHLYSGDRVELFRISPRILFRKGDLHGRLQCNSYFIESADGVCIVDPASMEASGEMREEISSFTGKPLRYVFMTHNHLDHAAGLAGFITEAPTVFCSHRCAEDVRRSVDGRLNVVGVDGTASLHLNGATVELEDLRENAHSPWDMLVHIAEDRAVCTGDLVAEFCNLYFHAAVPERWIAILRKLSNGRDDVVLPGHGEPCGREMFGETANFIGHLLDCAGRLMDVNYPPEEALKADAPALNRIVGEFLAGNSADAETISRGGGGDAHRLLFMMLRNLLGRRFY
ncbi:MAG: MBL fold metallo-hydrolase [Oscillospiraceae bacterium]|jgi:cyclase|nr:MBL fold metallo-hydrolase [Oscillospiraceae bacterium]